MSRRNTLEAKRARREKREAIVSDRLKRDQELTDRVRAFVDGKIAEAKAQARERLDLMTLAQCRAEAERFRASGGELPPKSQLRSKRAIIAALVPEGNPLHDADAG